MPKKKRKVEEEFSEEEIEEEDDEEEIEKESRKKAKKSKKSKKNKKEKKHKKHKKKKQKVVESSSEEKEDSLEESEEDEEENDGFDESLHGDDEDIRYLESLNEVEREIIIAERADKRDAMLARIEAKRYAESKKPAVKKNKKKLKKVASPVLSEVDEDDEMEEDIEEEELVHSDWEDQTKQPTSTKKLAGLLDDETSDEEPPPPRNRNRREPELEEYGLDDSEDYDMEDKQASYKPEPIPLKHHHIKHTQLRRHRLEDLVFEPFFEEYIKDFFVRVTLPRQKHVMCQITGLTTFKNTYRFKNRDYKKALACRIGNVPKAVAMMTISNSTITEEEFATWKKTMETQDIEIPSSQDIIANHARAAKLQNDYHYTTEIKEKMIAERHQGSNKFKSQNLNMVRMQLNDDLRAAEHAGDKDKVAQISKDLEQVIETIAQNKRRKQETVADALVGLTLTKRNNLLKQQREEYLARLAQRKAGKKGPVATTVETIIESESNKVEINKLELESIPIKPKMSFRSLPWSNETDPETKCLQQLHESHATVAIVLDMEANHKKRKTPSVPFDIERPPAQQTLTLTEHEDLFKIED